ncbi:MAG: hypothetical protein ACYCSR_06055 [Thiomonas sp.]
MEYRVPVKIRAMLGPKPTEQGYPMTGIVSTPDGDYLGAVSGFVPRPQPKRKGRPKTPEAAMLRYCKFLAQWANPQTNTDLTDKPGARRRAGLTVADENTLQRQARRDELACMGWLEVVIHQRGIVHEVIVFPATPAVAVATNALRIIGPAWRYQGGALAHGDVNLTIALHGDADALVARIRAERTILALPGAPDI